MTIITRMHILSVLLILKNLSFYFDTYLQLNADTRMSVKIEFQPIFFQKIPGVEWLAGTRSQPATAVTYELVTCRLMFEISTNIMSPWVRAGSFRRYMTNVPPLTVLSHTNCYLFVHTEILDFGYPQNSETGALKTFITQQGIKGQVSETDVDSHQMIMTS